MKALRASINILFYMTVLFGFESPVVAEIFLQTGAGVKHFRYWEHLATPYKSIQSGPLPHLLFGAEVTPSSRSWFLAVKIDFADGPLKYDGTEHPPSSAPVQQFHEHRFLIFEGQLGVGLGSVFGFERNQFYGGVSHRTWYRMLINPNETYRLLSTVLGFRILPKTPSAGSLGLDISFRRLVQGDMTAVLHGYDEAKFKVRPAAGFRVELPIWLSTNLTLVPWYERSSITGSDLKPLTVNGVQHQINGQPVWIYEPSSCAQEIGLDLIYRFSL